MCLFRQDISETVLIRVTSFLFLIILGVMVSLNEFICQLCFYTYSHRYQLPLFDWEWEQSSFFLSFLVTPRVNACLFFSCKVNTLVTGEPWFLAMQTWLTILETIFTKIPAALYGLFLWPNRQTFLKALPLLMHSPAIWFALSPPCLGHPWPVPVGNFTHS